MRRSLRHPSLVQCLRKGCPCQDLLYVWAQGGRRLISGDLQLAKFILELALPDDDIAKSAVTVEGDRRS